MLKIEQLTFRYKKRPPLFRNLNLSLAPGNIYGLLGKNGAGKTTLLKLIAGLLFPQQGRCRFMDYDPVLRLPEFLAEIYFIPEEFYTPPVSVKQYEALYAPFYPHFDSQRFAQYISDFKLTPTEKLSSLSYGQKKKFLVAFGLACNSSLLILDEPTNGLDIPSKSLFRKLLASSMTGDRTFIISTHQVRDMENLIDPIIILDEGEIIFQQFINDITRKLAVQIQQDEPDPAASLYSEKILGGYAVISEQHEGREESKIDLELLFNAVIENRDKINALFSQEVVHER